MRQIVTVISSDDTKVKIRLADRAECSKCSGCSNQKPNYMMLDKDGRNIASGDRLEINIPDSNALVAISVLFLLPLVCLAIGVLVGSLFGGLVQGILIVVMLAISVGLIVIIDKKSRTSARYQITIVDVVTQ